MSNLIKDNVIVADEWTRVIPPNLGEETVRKQAGKVVLFKLTGEETFSPEQIAATEIPIEGIRTACEIYVRDNISVAKGQIVHWIYNSIRGNSNHEIHDVSRTY